MIGANSNAISEIKITGNDAGLLGVWIISQKASIRPMLEEIGFQIGQTKLIRSIGKIDGAIVGNVEIVGTAKGNAFGFGT